MVAEVIYKMLIDKDMSVSFVTMYKTTAFSPKHRLPRPGVHNSNSELT